MTSDPGTESCCFIKNPRKSTLLGFRPGPGWGWFKIGHNEARPPRSLATSGQTHTRRRRLVLGGGPFRAAGEAERLFAGAPLLRGRRDPGGFARTNGCCRRKVHSIPTRLQGWAASLDRGPGAQAWQEADLA